MRNFSDAERACEASFFSGGPYWHASTPGKDTPILFKTKEEYVLVMNIIAQASAIFPDVKVIAFSVMNNHFHFVFRGERQGIEEFFKFITKRLSKLIPGTKGLQLRIDPIQDMNSMRNRIVYDHRNGYVANNGYTPFSYPWSTGRYYFNDIPTSFEYSKLSTTEQRLMFRGRAPILPQGWKIIDGYISPSSCCHLMLGMSMFRDAHHYFSMLYKEVEAFREMACEDLDGEYLTDSELFNQLVPIFKRQYGVMSFRDLTKNQKLELASMLRYDYKSSNGQIRRVLGLSQYDVDAMFPLRKQNGATH